jgi:hypothetical protein
MLRFAYIFDLTDNMGQIAPNNPYRKGTIYTQAQINQALQGGIALADAISRATAPPTQRSPLVMATTTRSTAGSLRTQQLSP